MKEFQIDFPFVPLEHGQPVARATRVNKLTAGDYFVVRSSSPLMTVLEVEFSDLVLTCKSICKSTLQ